MHKGIWCPKNEKLTPKILILGESHYGDVGSQGQESTGLTKEVIEQLLAGNIKDRWKEFFYKIAMSFGYKRDIDDIANFYNRVYFGNYVDVLCGVGEENNAIKYIKKNRIRYNNELFDFCNTKEIDIIICFSISVYNNSPTIELSGEKDYEFVLGTIGKERNIVRKTIFKKGPRVECEVGLYKDLILYGVRHPSCKGGYDYDQVYKFLTKELNGYSVCK